jgi:predicted transcriptional regulator
MDIIRTRARGELEGSIMRILRDSSAPMSAKDVQAAMDGQVPAYTTVMTALDRLHKKGEVIRSGDSPRKIRFEATRSEQEHASQAMVTALGGASDRTATLLRFAGTLDDDDLDALRRAINPERGQRAPGKR